MSHFSFSVLLWREWYILSVIFVEGSGSFEISYYFCLTFWHLSFLFVFWYASHISYIRSQLFWILKFLVDCSDGSLTDSVSVMDVAANATLGAGGMMKLPPHDTVSMYIESYMRSLDARRFAMMPVARLSRLRQFVAKGRQRTRDGDGVGNTEMRGST